MMQFTLLTREEIMAARSRRKTQVVRVPEWSADGNGVVVLVELSGAARDAFDADLITLSTNGKQSINMRNVRAKLAAKSIADPESFDITEVDGQLIATLKPGAQIKLLFNELEANDLGELSATALDRVFGAAQTLSGIKKEDIDEMTGDLKKAQSGNFGTN